MSSSFPVYLYATLAVPVLVSVRRGRSPLCHADWAFLPAPRYAAAQFRRVPGMNEALVYKRLYLAVV